LLLLSACTAPKPAVKSRPTSPPPLPKLLFSPLNAANITNGPAPHKNLPELRYPTNTPAVWTLQYSDDLIHWHNFVHFGTSPMQMQGTAPPVGSRFFRYIGTSFAPEGFRKHLPGADD